MKESYTSLPSGCELSATALLSLSGASSCDFSSATESFGVADTELLKALSGAGGSGVAHNSRGNRGSGIYRLNAISNLYRLYPFRLIPDTFTSSGCNPYFFRRFATCLEVIFCFSSFHSLELYSSQGFTSFWQILSISTFESPRENRRLGCVSHAASDDSSIC